MTSPVSMPAGHKIVAADLDAYENATAAWVTWVPTLTNMTLGDGTVTAKYRWVGKTLDYRFKFVLGSTSAMGTSPTFSLPPGATLHANYVAFQDSTGDVQLRDASVGSWRGVSFMSTTTSLALFFMAASANIGGITSTIPFTWVATDALMCAGTLELA